MFEVPIVIFLFRRINTLQAIFDRIASIKPQKVYLIADCGRNEKEIEESNKVRQHAESLITWDCEVIKNYALNNRGVYENIGLGAKWVFEREKTAIFIEDDNLPESSFFVYAAELLSKYEADSRIGWICGTNYYTELEASYSYFFTNQLLPCGWASWSDKFMAFYDGELDSVDNHKKRRRFIKSYHDKVFGYYQLQLIKNEYYRKKKNIRFASWDYQMLWSIRTNSLLGIAPSVNQITNIGVDDFSIHGGNSKNNILTNRFCEVPSKALTFPLVEPDRVEISKEEDYSIERIIKPSKKVMLKLIVGSKLKHLLGVDTSIPWRDIIRVRFKTN